MVELTVSHLARLVDDGNGFGCSISEAAQHVDEGLLLVVAELFAFGKGDDVFLLVLVSQRDAVQVVHAVQYLLCEGLQTLGQYGDVCTGIQAGVVCYLYLILCVDSLRHHQGNGHLCGIQIEPKTIVGSCHGGYAQTSLEYEHDF